MLTAMELKKGGPKCQDIINRNVNEQTASSEHKWFDLHSCTSNRSKIAASINGLRRSTLETVQKETVLCHKDEITLFDWCINAGTCYIRPFQDVQSSF